MIPTSSLVDAASERPRLTSHLLHEAAVLVQQRAPPEEFQRIEALNAEPGCGVADAAAARTLSPPLSSRLPRLAEQALAQQRLAKRLDL